MSDVDLTMLYEKQRAQRDEGSALGRLYLLDSALCVIGASAGEETAQMGVSFFDLFPANRLLRDEVAAYVASYPNDVLLTLCARTPVVFVGTLAAQTGLVVAAVPEGEIKRTLAAPAAFHRVPACVQVGTTAQMKYRAHAEAAFADAVRWLLALATPFLSHADTPLSPGALLSNSATRLAALFDVPLSLDLSGLLDTDCAGWNVAFAIGVVLSALTLARRVSPDAGVHLCGVSESAPTLYLELRGVCADDPLPELAPLLSCARARGAVLDAVFPREAPRLLQLRACVGIVELSAEGLRERARFLEGKSPLRAVPVPHAIPSVFPEISFD
ncbi:MAG: hypothetical protein J6U87_05010 [Clostridia bacterium]|nr:hypothetical protein [Clostridia bacterium]